MVGAVIPERTGESLAILAWLSKEMGEVAITLPVPKILLDGGCFCRSSFYESASTPRAGTPPTTPGCSTPSPSLALVLPCLLVGPHPAHAMKVVSLAQLPEKQKKMHVFVQDFFFLRTFGE